MQSHPWPETVHHRSKASSRLVSPMSASPILRSTPMSICGRFVTLLVVICTRSKLIIGQKKIGWNLTHGVKPTIFPIFLCPRDGRSGAYCFCPVYHSVIPSFRNSVILFETLTLPITAEALFFNIWPWLWSLVYFLETLILLITFQP